QEGLRHEDPVGEVFRRVHAWNRAGRRLHRSRPDRLTARAAELGGWRQLGVTPRTDSRQCRAAVHAEPRVRRTIAPAAWALHGRSVPWREYYPPPVKADSSSGAVSRITATRCISGSAVIPGQTNTNRQPSK